MRRLFVRTAAAAAVLAVASTAPAAAQIPTSGFEITPMVGYIFGGGFPTDGFTGVPAGKLNIDANIGYGIEVGYTPNGNTWFELTYMRQSSDVNFDPDAGTCADYPIIVNCTSSISTNYIHAGARWEFGQRNIKPFIGGGLGVTIFDPSASNIGSNTDFSLSLEGGVRYMFGKGDKQRVGIRGTFRGWFSFVPNGQYAAWCGYYGCYAQESSSTVTQGEVSGGLVFVF
ncbi:MAG: uncharacterized protein H6Q77_301 [Gemmatimonadetes bacterium]|jgi:hypothetical protein|nr:uncharacterized protein [Gemmatimonadota bacterium]